jgi:hypothetical protein
VLIHALADLTSPLEEMQLTVFILLGKRFNIFGERTDTFPNIVYIFQFVFFFATDSSRMQ